MTVKGGNLLVGSTADDNELKILVHRPEVSTYQVQSQTRIGQATQTK